MKLLAILRPLEGTDPRRQIAAQAREELSALWEMYRDDFVREMYSPGGPGAVLVLEAASAQEASRRLGALPLLASGTVTLEMIELRPFAALAMLF